MSELGEDLNKLFNAYLCASPPERIERHHDLLDALWTNKAGIIVELRACAPSGNTSTPAIIKTLEAAEQFIVNGVDYGFVNMPDAGDPAHDTLPAIRAALKGLRSCTAMTFEGWQDISTAPKDGTVILLASTDERGSKNLIECSWWSEERCWIDNGRRGKPDEYEADWYQVDNTDFSFSRPTHWRMPLSRPRKERGVSDV